MKYTFTIPCKQWYVAVSRLCSSILNTVVFVFVCLLLWRFFCSSYSSCSHTHKRLTGPTLWNAHTPLWCIHWLQWTVRLIVRPALWTREFEFGFISAPDGYLARVGRCVWWLFMDSHLILSSRLAPIRYVRVPSTPRYPPTPSADAFVWLCGWFSSHFLLLFFCLQLIA